jgi:hypothetical protein
VTNEVEQHKLSVLRALLTEAQTNLSEAQSRLSHATDEMIIAEIQGEIKAYASHLEALEAIKAEWGDRWNEING